MERINRIFRIFGVPLRPKNVVMQNCHLVKRKNAGIAVGVTGNIIESEGQVSMLRLLTTLWLLALFVLMTGCAHMKKTCSFQLNFIDDVPSNIGSYSLIEINSVELLPTVPWGIELYSDALTNINSIALTTKKSLCHYRRFLKEMKCLGIEELGREMESVMPREKERLPELDAQAFLQNCASTDCSGNYSFESLVSLSRDLASWIWTLEENIWKSVKDLGSVPMLSNILRMYTWGGIAVYEADYWDENKKNKRKQRLQTLVYACILSEKYPAVKRLYVDEFHKIRERMMQHGRVPVPVHVDVVDKRKFVFRDCNRIPFAELIMCFDYGYFGGFEEANLDSKMVLDMAFRMLLERKNKGSRIKGDIRHNLETGEIKVDIKE